MVTNALARKLVTGARDSCKRFVDMVGSTPQSECCNRGAPGNVLDSTDCLTELKVAAERLGKYGKAYAAKGERLFPDELIPGRKYVAGARKQVRVNAYERDPKARAACLKYHGFRCVVCGLLFEERYGSLGIDFIHVHHLKPLSLSIETYELDPVKDLRPVCPNCHSMLHRREEVLSIEALQKRIAGH